jgi:squalene-associated FAD-dependent desaturase
VDNGTHLIVGAYTATLDLVQRAGAGALLAPQENLRIDYVDDRGPSALRCPPLPAPWHLLFGLLTLRLPWRARWDALRLGLTVRFGRRPDGISLEEYFKKARQGEAVRRLLWDPLATAVVNEAPARAAALLFYNVYRETFLANRRGSRLVFLRRGWGALHEQLARYFEGRGGTLRRRALASGIDVRDGRAAGVACVQRAETRDAIRAGKGSVAEILASDAVVLAVPWSAVPALLPEELRSQPPWSGLPRLGSSPIVSVEMWLDRMVVDKEMVGLRDSELEWVFDKGWIFGRKGAPQHLSFIVSAAHRSLERSNGELVAAAEAALRRYFPAMREAAVLRSLVLREPEATFSAGPEGEALRPANATALPGLFLAGDWTATGLPATIEGAVRSGYAAAEAVESRA